MKTDIDALIEPSDDFEGQQLLRTPSNASSIALGATLQAARRQFEREYVTAVLETCHWRIPEAARMLGIQRPNLYRAIRRLKISRGSNPSGDRTNSPFVLVDPRITHADPYDPSVDDYRRSYRRRRAALRSNLRG